MIEDCSPHLKSTWVGFVHVRHGIRLAGGRGALKDKVTRIGRLSPRLSTSHLNKLLAALRDFIETRT